MSVQANLKVLTAPNDEVYKDLVRIPSRHRGGLLEGRVCKITVGKNSVYRSLRGWGEETAPVIQMDMITRDRLGVRAGQTYQFIVKPSGLMGQFLWAWYASDPAPRYSARLGIVGLGLGVIGLIMSVVPLLYSPGSGRAGTSSDAVHAAPPSPTTAPEPTDVQAAAPNPTPPKP